MNFTWIVRTANYSISKLEGKKWRSLVLVLSGRDTPMVKSKPAMGLDQMILVKTTFPCQTEIYVELFENKKSIRVEG